MTGRERVLLALAGKPADILPALSITSTATIEAMQLSGAFYPEAHTDAAKIAALAAASRDLAGFDSVSPYFSIHLEAAALGAEMDWNGPAGTPYVKGRLLESLDELKIPNDFLSLREPQALLTAIRLLRKRYGNETAVIGKVIGPWTILYHLYGVENLLLETLLDPEHTKAVLMALSDIPVAFAKAQFEAGADAVVWADHATSDLVSAALYEETLYPVHCRAAASLTGFGPTILHCCGNVEDRVRLFASTGFTCFHADSRNDIQRLIDDAGGRILLAGFVNNPIVLSHYAPHRIAEDAERIIGEGIRMVCPECAIPTTVTGANLRALTTVLHRRIVRS